MLWAVITNDSISIFICPPRYHVYVSPAIRSNYLLKELNIWLDLMFSVFVFSYYYCYKLNIKSLYSYWLFSILIQTNNFSNHFLLSVTIPSDTILMVISHIYSTICFYFSGKLHIFSQLSTISILICVYCNSHIDYWVLFFNLRCFIFSKTYPIILWFPKRSIDEA